jgi:hypothetical protein
MEDTRRNRRIVMKDTKRIVMEDTRPNKSDCHERHQTEQIGLS